LTGTSTLNLPQGRPALFHASGINCVRIQFRACQREALLSEKTPKRSSGDRHPNKAQDAFQPNFGKKSGRSAGRQWRIVLGAKKNGWRKLRQPS
jgi:hypothetical protein